MVLSGLKKLLENIQKDRIECNSEQKPTRANNGKVVFINWIFILSFFFCSLLLVAK